jgi:transcriptional regulator with XRE-family HTH domain
MSLTKVKTIKEILRSEGRTQTWLRTKLEEYGIKRDKSQISMYCSGKYRPRDEYVLRAISEILQVEFEEINSAFNI